ncbi:MAG TPA: ABC transporter permease [Candidatus Anammoximicrobium sp.]|nr:ABC transporter permease [Candidatus Anammoximicrobium sp.]
MDEPQPSTELTFEDTPQRTPLWGATALVNYLGLLLVLLFQVALFSALCDHFFTLQTLATVANQIPDLTVIAVGMTLVLIIGGIDLSVGSVLALGAAVLGVAMVDWQFPLWAAALLCVGAGLVCGLVNGVVSVGWSIPSFIVTLGMLEIARGCAYLTTESQTKYIGARIEGVAAPLPGLGVSAAFLAAVAVVIAGQFLLSRTVFGRYMLAIGNNEQVVRYSGIQPWPTKIAVFVLAGGLSALGGVFQASRLGSADPNGAVGMELSAIAAVVIGGTSLMGGRGSVINSFLGVLIIRVLESGLAQYGVSDPAKRIVTGGVIVAAVIADAYRHRLSGRRFRLLRRWFSPAHSP